MHHRPLLAPFLVVSLACGPGVLDGDTDGSSTSTGGPGPGSSSGSEGPGEPTTTADPPMTITLPTTSGDEPSGCPEGQPWSSLGSSVLTVPEGFAAGTYADNMVVMADGRIAVAGVIESIPEVPAVLFLSPAGEVLGMTTAEPSEAVAVSALRRAADDSLVLWLARLDPMMLAPGLLRLAPDGSLLGEVPLAESVIGAGFALADDTAVIAGRDRLTAIPTVAKFAIETGAMVWSVALDEPDVVVPSEVVVTPEGDIFVAGGGDRDVDANFTVVRMWKIGGDGQIEWANSLARPPFGIITAFERLPGGQLAVLRRGPDDDQTIELLAVDAADGSPAWELPLAAPDVSEEPYARALLVDADALSIPVMRSEPEFSALRSIAVQRVSFGGQLLEVVPLEVPARPSRGWTTVSVRGNCDELVILSGEFEELWLGSFAP
ncbi:PQQ-binding-like beta-propeller repeat protein [Nannocystis sp. SCPEA4]|uniref:outer membrane protein assembly factor BamB family protein n=1 Tax=Nannocystis sp. SCPEA4 TaxID=2996787 RepID=UPI0022707A45|nr:PQQ-binding-like beta-propeller repeat protein [Nannocystis sp. SCPEA4]MCY1054807.1 PQQ-binding-like beta-propeller repeat protein [Nannocystis sp. SCPEA4]